MKIVLVGNTAPEDRMGGLGRYVRELAGALAAAGADVRLAVKRLDPDSPRLERAPDGVLIDRHPVPTKATPAFGAAYPFFAAAGNRRSLRDAGPDAVVHAHFPVTALPLALGRRPYLYTLHAPVWRELHDEAGGTYRVPPGAVAGLRAVERLVVGRAVACLTLSEFMRTEVALLSGRAAARTTVLPGGIDGERFSPGPRRPDLRALGSPLLFSARRMTPRTGVGDLLRAMPAVLERHPGALLALAGTGHQLGELQALANDLGLGDRARFLGRISDAELVDYYRAADLAVMPTRELEGFGLTTAEALACGTPVVGTPAGATPEILNRLDPALVTEAIGPEALARCILATLADPARLELLRARARASVMPEMGWPAIARAHLDRYLALTVPSVA